jgi:hypothetical protein
MGHGSIINGIRKFAWFKMKEFKKEASRKKLLFLTKCTIQALWTHQQQETINGSSIIKFIHLELGEVARLTMVVQWATKKSASNTKALALSLGNLWDDSTDQDGSTTESYNCTESKNGVCFKDDNDNYQARVRKTRGRTKQ